MAATAPSPLKDSYEEFVGLHADRFEAYLRGALGRQGEGQGGRIGVEDTLQEALLAIYARWPEFAHAEDEERDRRLYRCLRDAAVRALRSEHGQQGRGRDRPRIVAFDFGAVHAEEGRPDRERELQAAVMGEMVLELADDEDERVMRASLDRGVLVAGLSALSEAEVVVMLAVDRLGWDQRALAEHLGMSDVWVRQTLFTARQLFYTLVRHAVGIEADAVERGQLFAYAAGELKGAEKRAVRRHLRHCENCQRLEREMLVFGRDALGVLSPLSFVFGAKVLVERSVVKPAAAVGSGTAVGLFAQAGAAKATIAVVGLLGLGTGTVAVLAELQNHPAQVGPRPAAPIQMTTGAAYTAPGGMRRVAVPATRSTKSGKGTKTTKKSAHRSHKEQKKRSSSSSSSSSASTTTQRQAVPPTSSQSQSSGAGTSSGAPKSSSSGTSGSDEFFAG